MWKIVFWATGDAENIRQQCALTQNKKSQVY